MTITFPADTKTIIDNIRDSIGRDIIIYNTVSGIPCSVCSLNPITNLSTDPFCSTCDGEFWINTVSGTTITAVVYTSDSDSPWRVSAGNIVKGDLYIQLEYSATNYTLVTSADSFVVDGRVYLRKDISYRGVPDINRMVITLIQQEG